MTGIFPRFTVDSRSSDSSCGGLKKCDNFVTFPNLNNEHREKEECKRHYIPGVLLRHKIICFRVSVKE